MTTKTMETRAATMDSRKLHEALLKANLILNRKDVPTLSYAQVEFANKKAVIITTDLERVIRVEIDSNNTEDFTTLLPRKTTDKFTNGGNGNLSISLNKLNKVSLSRNGIGDLNLTIPQMSDFPTTPPIPDNLEWHTLDSKWFYSMLRIISLACAEEGSRPVLTGIAFNDGKMAAADGFRLHVLKDDRLEFGLKDKQAIIPSNTINIVCKLFGKEKSLEVSFDTTKSRVYFKSANVFLTSELIQGTYPVYEQLIPNSFNCKVSFSAPLMLQRLNIIDAQTLVSGIVRYVFEMTKTNEQVCSISSHTEDEYSYQLSCPVKFEGDATKIAFNHQYMVDSIKPFSLCNLELTSPSSPMKITGDIEGLAIIVMPMYVQW